MYKIQGYTYTKEILLKINHNRVKGQKLKSPGVKNNRIVVLKL